MAPRDAGVGEHDVHHGAAADRGLGPAEPETGSAVLATGHGHDVVRAAEARARGHGYSVEMLGSACWVTGRIVRKCSAGSSMSGASPSAVSDWPLSRSASR